MIFLVVLVSGVTTSCNLAPPPAQVKEPKKAKKVPIEKVKTIEAPTGWPQEIPLYPTADIESVVPEGAGFTLRLKTDDTAAQIFNWYYDMLEAQKWEMAGPTLDVARNIAIINGKLGDKTLFLEARTSEEQDGSTSLSLTAGLPQPVQ